MLKVNPSLTLCILLLTSQPLPASVESWRSQLNRERFVLSQAQASHFAQLALKCARKEYPNKIEHVLSDADQLRPPKSLHTAFYGCYDWHSSVNGHWLLACLLSLHPSLTDASVIHATLTAY